MRSSRTRNSASRSVGFDACSPRASTAGTRGTPARRKTASWREKRTRSIALGLKNDGSARWRANGSFFLTGALRATRVLGEEDIALHLVERGHVVRHLLQCIETHRTHAFGQCLGADLVRRGAVLQQRLHAGRELEQLKDADAIEVAGAGAAAAPRAAREHVLLHAELAAERVDGADICFLHIDAVGTDLSHQALGHDPGHAAGDEESLYAEVLETQERADGVRGVQRTQHQVTGQRRVDRELRRLGVTDLPDEDDVGVVAQYGAQTGLEA